MHALFQAASDQPAIPISFVTKSSCGAVRAGLPEAAQRFAEANGYTGKAGQYLALPGPTGELSHVLFGLDEPDARGHDPFRAGALPGLLPAGVYRFANPPQDARLAVLAFAIGAYKFARYRKAEAPAVKLVLPDGLDDAAIGRIADAVALARDLINTPSNDMGPAELADAAEALATRFGATFDCIVGDDLAARNFPLIRAVGMASTRAPRLIDFSWGDASHPKVTLVGKGVCFDTGGLDLKPSSAMLIMKKDMGGAANVLALASMVMDSKLKVRLRVLIPAVENAVAGNAMRPMDVFPSRKGPTVEIGNTDAEGRLVLADALAFADEDKPDLLIDLATLTGAARVALGPDLPPFYTQDEGLAEAIAQHGVACNDPVWRLPLWKAYEPKLDGKIADLTNAPAGGMAGSIMAALFLKRFVSPGIAWAHFDIYAWTPAARPGRPEGGEAQAARLIFALVREKFGLAKL